MKKQKIYDCLFDLLIAGEKQFNPKTAKSLMELGYVKEIKKIQKDGFGVFECIVHKLTPSGEDYILEHLREIGKDYKE